MTSGPAPGGDRNRFAAAGNDAQNGGRYGPGASYGAPAAGPNRYNQDPSNYGAQQDEAGQQSSWDTGRGDGESQGYGAYADRQLTAEEQEEEDVQVVSIRYRLPWTEN
jgi:hypothetical protein